MLLQGIKLSNSTVFVECKAWDNPLPADVITKLVGNVIMRNADSGWLITTGPLSKDAKGTQDEWENGDNNDKRSLLSFYTADRIIELLLDTKLIKACSELKVNLQEGYATSDTALLLITDIGRYWIVPVVAKNSGFVVSVIAFDASSGNQIVDYELVEELKTRACLKNK